MLRAKFPQSQTRIFRVSAFGYMIDFDKSAQNSSDIATEFAHSIRPVSLG
jgi:hypothetical protein